MVKPAELIINAEELGYSFLPTAEPHDIGYAELNVVIRPAPTEKHFDPEVVVCTVAVASDSVLGLRVHHPWILDTVYRVCAGHIRLEDRKGKLVTAFTFGGELHIDSNVHRTVCHFTSPAPILEHSRQRDTLEVLLGEEVEILFAERRAAARHDAARNQADGFDRRLAAADPLQLYLACLSALRAKIDQWPAWEEPIHAEFKHFLHTTLENRSADTAIEIPQLTDLL